MRYATVANYACRALLLRGVGCPVTKPNLGNVRVEDFIGFKVHNRKMHAGRSTSIQPPHPKSNPEHSIARSFSLPHLNLHLNPLRENQTSPNYRLVTPHSDLLHIPLHASPNINHYPRGSLKPRLSRRHPTLKDQHQHRARSSGLKSIQEQINLADPSRDPRRAENAEVDSFKAAIGRCHVRSLLRPHPRKLRRDRNSTNVGVYV